MNAPSTEAQAILDKLLKLAELIEGHKATLYLLEHERMSLQSQLRATGWRPPATDAQGDLLR